MTGWRWDVLSICSVGFFKERYYVNAAEIRSPIIVSRRVPSVIPEEGPLSFSAIDEAKKLTDVCRIQAWWRERQSSGAMLRVNPRGQHTPAFQSFIRAGKIQSEQLVLMRSLDLPSQERLLAAIAPRRERGKPAVGEQREASVI